MGKRKRKTRKGNRLIVVLLSDTHAGQKLALLNPATVLSDEHGESYSPGLTTTQRYLWTLYQQHIEDVASLADGCRVILVHVGDITQGTRFVEHLCLTSINDQILGAIANLRPWYEHARIALTNARIIVGTGVHGWEGSAEALIGKGLAEMYPAVDTKTVYHAQVTLKDQQGQVLDLAHHGPHPGTRKWLEGNAAMWYLRSAMLDEIVDRDVPPIVYARAHYHTYRHVGPLRIRQNGSDIESRLIITPCYTGATDYTRKVTRSIRKLDHGLVALEFENGLKDVHPFYQELDIRQKEEL